MAGFHDYRGFKKYILTGCAGEIEAKIRNTPVPHYTTALRPADWSIDTRFFAVPRGAAPRDTAKICVSTD